MAFKSLDVKPFKMRLRTLVRISSGAGVGEALETPKTDAATAMASGILVGVAVG